MSATTPSITNQGSLATLTLKVKEERRLRSGHLWIYSNEIDPKKSPLSEYSAGEQVLVEDSKGHKLGIAYINPHTLISARIVSRDPKIKLDKSLLIHRINVALSLRQRYYEEPYYRLLYGESDGVPGLIVDRFADTLVVQINTAGMDQVKDDIIAALEKTMKPSVIIFKNDTSSRETEGLTKSVEVIKGSEPEFIHLKENNASFDIPALSGQKTGWFYDHRASRQRLQALSKGKRILDVFSYMGGWGIQAARAGASEVMCIDSSELAIDAIHRNADINKVSDTVATLKGDAFDAMKELRSAKEKFDIVVLDPPAFIKRKKDHAKGMQAYQRLNQQAMQLIQKDGLLVTASCSFHLKRDELLKTVLKASRHVDRNCQILEQGHQGPDHPVHPAIPESEYLKTFFARVFR